MMMIKVYLSYYCGVSNVLPVTGEEDGVVLGALLALLDDPDARCRAQVCAAIAGVYMCPVYMYNLLLH